MKHFSSLIKKFLHMVIKSIQYHIGLIRSKGVLTKIWLLLISVCLWCIISAPLWYAASDSNTCLNQVEYNNRNTCENNCPWWACYDSEDGDWVCECDGNICDNKNLDNKSSWRDLCAASGWTTYDIESWGLGCACNEDFCWYDMFKKEDECNDFCINDCTESENDGAGWLCNCGGDACLYKWECTAWWWVQWDPCNPNTCSNTRSWRDFAPWSESSSTLFETFVQNLFPKVDAAIQNENASLWDTSECSQYAPTQACTTCGSKFEEIDGWWAKDCSENCLDWVCVPVSAWFLGLGTDYVCECPWDVCGLDYTKSEHCEQQCGSAWTCDSDDVCQCTPEPTYTRNVSAWSDCIYDATNECIESWEKIREVLCTETINSIVLPISVDPILCLNNDAIAYCEDPNENCTAPFAETAFCSRSTTNLSCGNWNGVCADNQCDIATPTCNDSIQNGTEEWVDCGGPDCPICAQTCTTDDECAREASCSDWSGWEYVAISPVCNSAWFCTTTKVLACTSCVEGWNHSNAACVSWYACGANWWELDPTATCSNGIDFNPNTTYSTTDGVVCGWSFLEPDASGTMTINTDYVISKYPESCPVICNNGIQDGSEIGIDCGGPDCPECQDECNETKPVCASDGSQDGQLLENCAGSTQCPNNSTSITCTVCDDNSIASLKALQLEVWNRTASKPNTLVSEYSTADFITDDFASNYNYWDTCDDGIDQTNPDLYNENCACEWTCALTASQCSDLNPEHNQYWTYEVTNCACVWECILTEQQCKVLPWKVATVDSDTCGCEYTCDSNIICDDIPWYIVSKDPFTCQCVQHELESSPGVCNPVNNDDDNDYTIEGQTAYPECKPTNTCILYEWHPACDDGDPNTTDVDMVSCSCTSICELTDELCDDWQDSTSDYVSLNPCTCLHQESGFSCPLTQISCDDNDSTTTNTLLDPNSPSCRCESTCGVVWIKCDDQMNWTYNDVYVASGDSCACEWIPCPVALTACDDGNPLTDNDVEDGQCGCAWKCPVAWIECNDGDPETKNDVTDWNCGCSWTLEECPVVWTACDDGNPWTENDQADGLCGCVWTLCPTAWTTCNDGNLWTENDVTNWVCGCAWTPCPVAWTICDDGNPATENDVENGQCECAWTLCPAVWTACNDGDPATINDQADGECGCVWQPNICQTWTDNVWNTPTPWQGCNDNNDATENDVYDLSGCDCAWTPILIQCGQEWFDHTADNNTATNCNGTSDTVSCGGWRICNDQCACELWSAVWVCDIDFDSLNTWPSSRWWSSIDRHPARVTPFANSSWVSQNTNGTRPTSASPTYSIWTYTNTINITWTPAELSSLDMQMWFYADNCVESVTLNGVSMFSASCNWSERDYLSSAPSGLVTLQWAWQDWLNTIEVQINGGSVVEWFLAQFYGSAYCEEEPITGGTSNTVCNIWLELENTPSSCDQNSGAITTSVSWTSTYTYDVAIYDWSAYVPVLWLTDLAPWIYQVIATDTQDDTCAEYAYINILEDDCPSCDLTTQPANTLACPNPSPSTLDQAYVYTEDCNASGVECGFGCEDWTTPEFDAWWTLVACNQDDTSWGEDCGDGIIQAWEECERETDSSWNPTVPAEWCNGYSCKLYDECTALLNVMLVLDKSGSMRDALDDLQTASNNFLQTTMSNPDSQAGAIYYSSSEIPSWGLTDDISWLSSFIDNMTSWWWTYIADALQLAIDEFAANWDPDAAWHIIMFTDWAIADMTEAEAIVASAPTNISISFVQFGNNNSNPWWLIANDGSYVQISDISQLEDAFTSLAWDACDDPDGSWPLPPLCNNGTLDANEACDWTLTNPLLVNLPSDRYCTSECNIAFGPACGDAGFVPWEGECSPPTSDTTCSVGYNASGATSNTCDYCDTNCQEHTVSWWYCGDSFISTPEEECESRSDPDCVNCACPAGTTADADGRCLSEGELAVCTDLNLVSSGFDNVYTCAADIDLAAGQQYTFVISHSGGTETIVQTSSDLPEAIVDGFDDVTWVTCQLTEEDGSTLVSGDVCEYYPDTGTNRCGNSLNGKEFIIFNPAEFDVTQSWTWCESDVPVNGYEISGDWPWTVEWQCESSDWIKEDCSLSIVIPMCPVG